MMTPEKEGIIMRMPLTQKLYDFDFVETKKKVSSYFESLEALKWKQAKLNSQQGLIASYDPPQCFIYCRKLVSKYGNQE